MAVTLGDVAAETGMSLPAVSQILNQKGSYRPETRERVTAAARRLGYQPNANAKAMVTRRFGCFALVLSSRPSTSLLAFGLAEAVDAALSQRGLHLILARLPDEQLTDPGYVPKILSHVMADGLIMNYNAGIPATVIELIGANRVPTVWLNSPQAHDAVRPDDRAGGRESALLLRGHRRLAWVDLNNGPDEISMHYSTVERREGFHGALAELGLSAQRVGRAGGVPFAERLACLRAVLGAADRPTAIATYGPNDAEVVCAAALAEGLVIGRDLDVVTIADRAYRFAGQAIDTLRIDGAAIGRQAVERLVDLAAGGAPQPPVVVPLTHEAGASLGALRGA